MEEGARMKKVLSCVSFCLFFLLLGIVGSMEHDTISLGKGTFWMFTITVALGVCLYRAGAFEYPNEKAAVGSGNSHDGKRKSSTQVYHIDGRKTSHG